MRVSNLEDATEHVEEVLKRVKCAPLEPVLSSRGSDDGVNEERKSAALCTPGSCCCRPARHILVASQRAGARAQRPSPASLTSYRPEYLRRAYKMPSWQDGDDFLQKLARSSGKLLKGGEADLNTAAKTLLQDWQRGRIPFFTMPPQLPPRLVRARLRPSAPLSPPPWGPEMPYCSLLLLPIPLLRFTHPRATAVRFVTS